MGRFISFFVATAIVLTSGVAPASAAITAGSKCVKAGQTQVQAGYKYTCSKAGTALVWKKGPKASSTSGNSSASKPRPKANDVCSPTSDWVIGDNGNGTLIYLSCGPDGKLHKQFGAPAIDQKTALPVVGRLGSTAHKAEYKTPPTIATKPQVSLSTFTVDPSPCKILDGGPLGAIANNPQRHFAAGFPIYPERAKLEKTVIQFIPVDFKDVRAKKTPAVDYAKVTAFLKKFWQTMGSKPINIEIRMPNSYTNLPNDVLSYDLASDFFKTGKPPMGTFDYARAAIAAADPQIDFSDVDVIAVVPPAEATTSQVASFVAEAAEPTRGFKTTEKEVMNLLVSSGAELTDFELLNWAHETGHMFGLSDIRNVPTASAQDSSPLGVFDLMNSMVAPELLAWQRFMLGTLYDNQVHCITSAGTTNSWLTPIEARDLGAKLAVIPTGKFTGIMVESRRSYGFDTNLGSANEGLIVYKIDTTIPYRLSPYRIVPSPSAKDDSLRRDAALKVGESVTIDGVTITNVESGAFGDVAKIERK